MTYYVMANRHIMAKTETLEDARERMKKLKQIADSFGLGGEAEWYILETV